MRYRAEQLDAVLQKMLLAHLQELDELGAGPADDEAHVREARTNSRRSGDEQVDTLAVRQPREEDNCNWTVSALSPALKEGIGSLMSLGSCAHGLNCSATRVLGMT